MGYGGSSGLTKKVDEPAEYGGLWLPDQIMARVVFSDPSGQSQTFMPRIRPVVSVDT
jgi:hypothetical protein